MDATKRLKSFDQNWVGLLIAYIVLDLLFVAGGMGVPIRPTSPHSEVALNEPDAIRQEPCWSPDGAYIVYELETTDHAFGSGMKPKRCRQLGRVRTGIKFSGVAETGRIPRRFELSQNRPPSVVTSDM